MMYEPVIHLYRTKLQEATDEAVDDMIFREIIKMGVLVEREELLKALRYDRAQYEKGYADGRADAQKWISVEERLPEDGVDVIIHTDFRGGYVGCGYYRIVRDAWFTSQGILLASNVLHWKPLPGMPEEEKDEEPRCTGKPVAEGE